MPTQDPSQIKHFLNQYLANTKSDLSPEETDSFKGLTGDTAEGYEALQYLLGNKKKEVETFYDKHPVQAVGQDLINSAPALGAGAIAAKGGHSFLKDFLLNHGIESARKSVGKKDGLKPLAEKDYNERPDLDRIFNTKPVDFPYPEFTREDEHGHPLSEDEAKETHGRAERHWKADTEAERNRARETTVSNRAALGETYNSMSQAKNKYPRFMGMDYDQLDDARIARLLGKNLPKNYSNQGPDRNATLNKATGSLFEKGEQEADHLSAAALKKHQDLKTPFKMFGKEMPVSKGKVENFAEHFVHPDTLKGENWKDLKGLKGLAGKNKLMTGAGAAIAGGMALSPVVNFLQRKIYGEKQTQEWMKNKRMTEGKFN